WRVPGEECRPGRGLSILRGARAQGHRRLNAPVFQVLIFDLASTRGSVTPASGTKPRRSESIFLETPRRRAAAISPAGACTARFGESTSAAERSRGNKPVLAERRNRRINCG